MKKLVFILLSVVTFSGFSQTTKKTLELPPFTSIYVNSNYTVYLKQTNLNEVKVEALTEIFNASEFKVEDGILMINIERKDNSNKSLWGKIDDIKVNPTMKVFISMKNVNTLMVNGGGKIISENSIAADNITLSVNGSGNMDIDLKGNKVTAEVSGSGNLNLRGYATTIDAKLSGSGSLTGFNCPVETAKVKASGSGNCDLNVSTSIDALVLGSSAVKHKGNTKTATKKVYGPGSVERAY